MIWNLGRRLKAAGITDNRLRGWISSSLKSELGNERETLLIIDMSSQRCQFLNYWITLNLEYSSTRLGNGFLWWCPCTASDPGPDSGDWNWDIDFLILSILRIVSKPDALHEHFLFDVGCAGSADVSVAALWIGGEDHWMERRIFPIQPFWTSLTGLTGSFWYLGTLQNMWFGWSELGSSSREKTIFRHPCCKRTEAAVKG